MKGTIRTLTGLLVVFGAVGGIDNGAPLIPAVLIALCGLVCMASGVFAMKGR